MKRSSIFSIYMTYSGLMSCLALCVFLLGSTELRAQISLGCNTFTSLTATSPASASLTVETSQFGVTNADSYINTDRLIDANTSNVATKAALAIAGTHWIEVRNGSTTSYPGGSFAGFVVSNAELATYFALARLAAPTASVTVATYLNGGLQDTYSNSDLLFSNIDNSNPATDKAIIGFVTSTAKPYNRIRFTVSGVTATAVSLYYPVVKQFCTNATELACNTSTTLSESVYPLAIDMAKTGITGTCVGCNVADPKSVIDGNPATAATIASLVSLSATASIAVKNQVDTYPTSTFVGFDVQTVALTSLDLLGSVSISLYNSGTLVQTNTGNNLLLGVSALSGGNARQTIGIVSTGTFNEAVISFTKTSVDLGTTSVYGATVKRFCANNTPLACNTNTILDETVYPISIDQNNTGIATAVTCVNCSISNPSYAIDGSSSTAATITTTAGIATTASIGIKNQLQTYPANTFVGFDIQNQSVLSANLLGSAVISLYNNTTLVQTVTSNSLVLGASVLSGGNTRQTIGIVSTGTFNIAKISFTGTLNVGTVSIFSTIVKRFCNGPALVCNTPTILDETIYPVSIEPAHTGITGIACVGCSVVNAGNVIDGSATTAATVSLSVSAGSTASISVKNQLQTYPINTFAGFDVETQSLVSASLFGSVTITLYNNGTAVQTGTGSSLILGAGSSALIGGNTRQIVGISSTVPAFNEVQISFAGTGADLGTTYVYSAISQSACEGIVLCNTTNYIQNPAFPAVINSARTGVTGAVCALCGVSNAANLISASTTDFASLTSSVGVGAQTSISVQSPVGIYPAGSYAGFVIQKNNLPVAVSLFNSLTISTYNDGVLQESSTSGGLLNLSLLIDLAGVPNGSIYNVGFATTKSFDEIQISLGALVNGFDQYINVYSAFVDTRTAFGGTLACFSLNPDFAVTTKNVPVSGNVKTNDVVGANVAYGTPVAAAGNPDATVPAMNADGSYTFTTAIPGSYTFTVPVCPASQTAACPTSTLTITVLDQAVTTNKPVVNPDYASTVGSPTSPTAVTINVKANDGPGNPGGVLGIPTISSPPASGTATVDGSGNVVYTPAAGSYGINVFTYQVCETPGGLCSSATVTVTVKAPSSTSIATTAVSTDDDYISTTQNASVTGNVLTNDSGTGLTVSNAGTITSPGKGTLVITSTGSYTFTPATGVTGPVDFTYTACDGGTPVSCGTATLHILVKKVPDLVIITTLQPSTLYNTSNFTVIGEVYEINSSAVTGLITVYVAKDPLFALSFDGAATFVGGRVVNNSVWTFDASNKDFYILTTNAGLVGGTKRVYGLTGVLTPGNTRGSIAVSSLIVGGSGGELNITNNSDADTIDYFNK